MAKVFIRDISKSFGTTKVLESLSLDIEDGEFICLLGPSGCGKTTILRIIAGLETTPTGQILIDGTVVNDLDPPARNIAMGFSILCALPAQVGL